MSKLVLAFLLTSLIVDVASPAELTLNRRSAREVRHITIMPAEQTIQLVYPRGQLYAFSGDRLHAVRRACWAWTRDGRIRLVAKYSEPCVYKTYRDPSLSPIRFVEFR
jgi:hypothetical protein